MNVVAMVQMSSFGMNQAVSTLMGEQIGLGDVDEAHEFSRAAYQFAICLNMGLSMIILMWLPDFVGFFTQLPEVLNVLECEENCPKSKWFLPSMPLMIAINCFPDCMKNMQTGIVKSLGLQK